MGGRRFEVTMLVLSRSVTSAVLSPILKSAMLEIETELQASKMPKLKTTTLLLRDVDAITVARQKPYFLGTSTILFV